MEIKIDAESVKGLVAEAILQQLNQGARDALIKASLVNLFERRKDNYGREQPANIERAFDTAAYEIAVMIVREECAKPEVREKFAETIRQAFLTALKDNTGMVSEMAQSITRCIKYKESY